MSPLDTYIILDLLYHSHACTLKINVTVSVVCNTISVCINYDMDSGANTIVRISSMGYVQHKCVQLSSIILFMNNKFITLWFQISVHVPYLPIGLLNTLPVAAIYSTCMYSTIALACIAITIAHCSSLQLFTHCTWRCVKRDVSWINCLIWNISLDTMSSVFS